MATLQYPYYTLSTQMRSDTTDRTTTKSLAAVNLPDMTTANRDATAGDLQIISRLIAQIVGNTYNKTTLTTREEVL